MIHFLCSDNGLYYHDLNNRNATLVNSKEEIRKVKRARELYGTVRYPIIRDFKAMIKNNMLLNCSVTIEDIDNCIDVFGPDIHVLKGRTVRKQLIQVVIDYIKIPIKVLKLYYNIVLAINIILVSNLPFLMIVLRNLKFGIVKFILTGYQESIYLGLQLVIV